MPKKYDHSHVNIQIALSTIFFFFFLLKKKKKQKEPHQMHFARVMRLVFSKYSFKKTVSYFPGLEQDFENSQWMFTENVFNNIVVNKLTTVDPTYLFKLFYLLN